MGNSFVLLLAACLATGQASPPAEDLGPQVKQLLKQLDAAEKSRRDEAEQQLLKLGTPVLSLLPDGKTGSAEVQLRLGRVRQQLETLQAEEEVRARTVSISGEALALEEVIATVAKQSGDKLIDFRREFGQQAGDKTLKLNFDKAPFWPALDQILDQAMMTTYHFAGETGLALVNRASTERPRYNRGTYAGAFRIEATEVEARRDLRDPNGQSLKLQLEVAWEPRLAPIAVFQDTQSVTAVGDNGQALDAGSMSDLESTVNPGDTATQIPLSFALPPRAVTKIASLKGRLSLLLPGPVETFRFEKLTVGGKEEQRRAGVKVILEQVRQNRELWEVRVRLVFDKPGQALESHRTWVLHNEAILETADKQPVNFAGLETTRQSENEVGVAYLFDVGNIAGHTFVYKTPAVLMDASVTYELHDVPLP